MPVFALVTLVVLVLRNPAGSGSAFEDIVVHGSAVESTSWMVDPLSIRKEVVICLGSRNKLDWFAGVTAISFIRDMAVVSSVEAVIIVDEAVLSRIYSKDF